jgi:hypothetical protein
MMQGRGPGPRAGHEWARKIEASLPLYGLNGRTGQCVWTERRRTGNRRGIEYSDGATSLQVITSALPGPAPQTLLPGADRPVAVQVMIGGESVSFRGVAAATDDAWAASADFATFCVSVVGVKWPASALTLAPVDQGPHGSARG